MKGEQIPLSVQLRGSASFDSYHPGPNLAATQALRELAAADRGAVLIHGAAGTGKTHLLQATARAAQTRGATVIHLPLRSLLAAGPEVIDGLGDSGLVCLDDLDAIAGAADWSHALIRLLDRLRTASARWAASSTVAPDRLDALLPDLRTRLSAAPGFGLRPLADDDRRAWLRSVAAERGLELSEETARWLLHHLPRDSGSLLGAIDTLDRASLRDQRRLTVPFVQKVLGAP